MAVTDPIADFLTRIRNAQMAGHRMVDIPSSNLKKHLTEILYEQGYILKYRFDDEAGKQGVIQIALKYDPVTSRPVIRELVRVSKPGLRKYVSAEELPRTINNLGISIISTNKGLMTDKKAKELHIGGEYLCYIC